MKRSIDNGFLIGPCVVEPQLNRLQTPAGTVRLEPKIMRVLVRLAENAGEVVDREALRRAAWGDEFAGEDGLRRAISILRRSLGEGAQEARFIETVPRVGYRLVAPIEAVGSPAAPTRSARRVAPLRALLFGATCVALVVLVAGAVRLRQDRTSVDGPPSLPLARSEHRVVPITTYPGSEIWPSLSPDGSQVVFPWHRHDGGSDLYVKLLDAEQPLRLTDHEGTESFPAWSPDGQRIAFVRTHDQVHKVLLVPPLGGAEEEILDLGERPAHGLSWSPDSDALVLSLKSGDEPFALFRFDLASSGLVRLTSPPAGYEGDTHPVWAPDGREIAFIRMRLEHGANDLYSVGAAGGSARVLAGLGAKIEDVAWSRDSRHVIFSFFHGGFYGLWRSPRDGGRAEALGVERHHAIQVDIARHGERMVYMTSTSNNDLWEVDLARGSEPRRLVASTYSESHVQVSPDGQRLAFMSKRSGSSEIWIADRDGGGAVQKTTFGGPFTAHPRWSPDGSSIAFDSRPGGMSDVYVVEVSGGAPRRLTNHPAEDVAANWSRDGERLYFASNRGGDWQVWRRPLAGGDPEQVTHDGGYFAAESLDQRFVYFSRITDGGLWRLPIEGGAEELVIRELRRFHWGNWLETERGLHYLTVEGDHRLWMRLDPETGESSEVFSFPLWPDSPSIDLTPDGHLIYAAAERFESDLILVEPSARRATHVDGR